jgi:hypothetical protein
MRKLEALKVGMSKEKKKRKKTCFVSWKAYFFIIPFPLHFKDDF